MNNQNPQRISISADVLNNVLTALAQQPYAQVSSLIEEVQKDCRAIQSDAGQTMQAVPKDEAVGE